VKELCEHAPTIIEVGCGGMIGVTACRDLEWKEWNGKEFKY
jgi:hypothetical protein